jgi:hypothetical protein
MNGSNPWIQATDYTGLNNNYNLLLNPNGGNVGIGTSLPAALLHVAKSADGGVAEIVLENSFTNAGSSTDEITQIQGRFGGYDASYITTGKEGDFTTAALRKSYLAFSTRTATTGITEKVRIDSSGNVGIGISNPSDYYTNFNDLVLGSTSTHSGMTIASGTSHDGTIAFADGTSGDAEYKGYIQYNHTNNAFSIGTNGVEAMQSTRQAISLSPLRHNSWHGGWHIRCG